MTDLVWDFEVDGGNFELAGSASQTTKSRLKQLGLPNETVRKVLSPCTRAKSIWLFTPTAEWPP